MKEQPSARLLFSMIAVLFLLPGLVYGQGDFYFSFNDLNSGATNTFANQTYQVGDIGSVFVYYDASITSELDTGAFLELQALTNGVINFTGGEALDFDIVQSGNPSNVVGQRWTDFNNGFAGEANVSASAQAATLGAFQLNAFGMVDTPGVDDTGFDTGANAYQFARLDFEVVGLGSTLLAMNRLDSQLGFPDEADMNQDGVVDLSDIELFVAAITGGGFGTLGDVNMDGVVNVLDRRPFSEILEGSGGIVHDGNSLNPIFGGAQITVIPEPTSFLVIAAGAMGLAVRRKRLVA